MSHNPNGAFLAAGHSNLPGFKLKELCPFDGLELLSVLDSPAIPQHLEEFQYLGLIPRDQIPEKLLRWRGPASRYRVNYQPLISAIGFGTNHSRLQR